MLDPVIITALSSAASAALAAFLTWSVNRKSAEMEEDKASVAALTASNNEWRTLYQELRNRIEEQGQQIGQLTDRIHQQEEREHRMVADLDAVFKWIEDGATPPPPSRPSYLARKEFYR